MYIYIINTIKTIARVTTKHTNALTHFHVVGNFKRIYLSFEGKCVTYWSFVFFLYSNWRNRYRYFIWFNPFCRLIIWWWCDDCDEQYTHPLCISMWRYVVCFALLRWLLLFIYSLQAAKGAITSTPKSQLQSVIMINTRKRTRKKRTRDIKKI